MRDLSEQDWLDSLSPTCQNVESLEEASKDLIKTIPSLEPDYSNKERTLYETIRRLGDISAFSTLLERFPSLVNSLSDTTQEHTLWIPTDAALKRVPAPTVQNLEAFLKTHVSPHYIPSKQFFFMPNIPMLLSPPRLKGPQVIRVRPSPCGYRVNIYATVTKSDIFCRNGVIHLIDDVLSPAQDTLDAILRLPNKEVGTFLNASNICGVAETIANGDSTGRTIFLPNNAAFQSLGEEVEAFLLRDEAGKRYLEALLKYHVLHDKTLFSNMLYPENVTGQRLRSDDPDPRLLKGKRDFEMPSLLGEEGILSIDVVRYGGFISMHVNESTNVIVQDVQASDGVIHVIDRVLLPGNHRKTGEKMTVDGLKNILEPFIEEEDRTE